MHGPPAVSFPVGRSRWHAVALASAMIPAVLAWPWFWLAAGIEFSPAAISAHVLLVLAVGVFAMRAWYRSPEGRLRWDGERWWWSDVAVQTLRTTLDAQAMVLVALRLEDSRPVWLWLERAQGTPQAWRSLRRALVYRAGAVVSGALPSQSTSEVLP